MDESIDNKQSITRFGEKLRILRKRQKWTLQELAHETSYTAHGYISELERGKKLPTVEFVLQLARMFNITTDELLKDELELSILNREDTDAIRSLGNDGCEISGETSERGGI